MIDSPTQTSNRNLFLEKTLSREFNKNIPGFDTVMCLKDSNNNPFVIVNLYYCDYLLHIVLDDFDNDYTHEALSQRGKLVCKFNNLQSQLFNKLSLVDFINHQIYLKYCFHFEVSNYKLWYEIKNASGLLISNTLVAYYKNPLEVLKTINNIDLSSYFNGKKEYKKEEFLKKLDPTLSNTI